jgi:hypothetical protein
MNNEPTVTSCVHVLPDLSNAHSDFPLLDNVTLTVCAGCYERIAAVVLANLFRDTLYEWTSHLDFQAAVEEAVRKIHSETERI